MVKPYRFHGRLGLGPMIGLERSNALLLGMRLCAVASGSRASSGRNGRTSSGRAASARSMATAAPSLAAGGGNPADSVKLVKSSLLTFSYLLADTGL